MISYNVRGLVSMRNRQRIYISGRMSGLSEQDYTARFSTAEEMLKADYKVFNPVRWGWFLKHVPYRVALAFDIAMMCFCDRVYFLDGWALSNGACAEHQFAVSTGMIRMYEL